jgi:hypothetical protein
MQDLGNPDGVLFLSPGSLLISGSSVNPTRNAAADWSQNLAASSSATYAFNLAEGQIIRLGTSEDLQEQFTGQGGIAGDARPQFARPDQIAAMSALQEITPRTANKTKGIKFTGACQVAYLISTANLTSHTIRIDKAVMADNAALSVTNLLAVGANGLQTAFRANMYVTTVTGIAAALTGSYTVSDLSELWLEIAVTTPVSSTYRLYGVRFGIEFNFN